MPSGPPGRSEVWRLEAKPAVRVAAAGFVLLAVGLIFGATPLLVPGVGFLLLGGLAPAWVLLAARGASVHRVLDHHRVVEDMPFEATLVIRRGRLGLPGGTVDDALAGHMLPVGEPLRVLAGRPRLELRVVAHARRRGRHAFPAPSLRTVDALGLARAERPGIEPADEILVLPRTEPVDWGGHDRRRTLGALRPAPSHEPTGAGEIDGLREYLPGTPAARIHWPALARGAGLLERRLVSDAEAQPLIVLDPRTEDSATGHARLDAAVRAAASLALELARSGGCTLLVPGSRLPVSVGDLSGWAAVHGRLALVAPEPAGARAPFVRAAGRGAIIWVAAHVDAPALPVAAAAQAPRVILVAPDVLVGGLDARPVFHVSGCSGVILGAARSAARRRAAAR